MYLKIKTLTKTETNNAQYGSSFVTFCNKKMIKVIPQKLNLPINCFGTFPESSLLSTVSKNTIKMIGHHSRLRDMMGQSYPIYVSIFTFCGSSKHTLFKYYLGKKT